jgi:hypothetical protein
MDHAASKNKECNNVTFEVLMAMPEECSLLEYPRK